MNLDQIISAAAQSSGLPRELVHAVCMVESSMNQWAIRFEPSYKWFYGQQDSLSATERAGQQMSWGLMQVMGAVARECGFTGWFPSLCDPEIGLKYGCKHLARFYARHRNWPDTIASYNAGSPRRTHDGSYVNQIYVDTVLRIWDEHEMHVPIKSTEA